MNVHGFRVTGNIKLRLGRVTGKKLVSLIIGTPWVGSMVDRFPESWILLENISVVTKARWTIIPSK